MKKYLINYETLLKITNVVFHSRDPEEITLLTVESITSALGIKGCAFFLVNRKKHKLELTASYGLSSEYLNKGPISSMISIAESLKEGPVAIYDVSDDPRIQYHEAAIEEGIASILSVPITASNGIVIGALRVYTDEPWEFTMNDVNFIQALAQISGMAMEMCRYSKGLKNSLDILKTMQGIQHYTKTRRTPYEGVPISIPVTAMA